MEKISNKDFNKIKQWVYRNSRPIELAIWQYHFENGTKDNVIKSLLFYQNTDGGFGHALEADLWNPNSSPYTTLWAINILNDIEFDQYDHPIVAGILKYFNDTPHVTNVGWDFSIPSNIEYAHAPWWSFNEDGNKTQNIGITAEVCSFIINAANKNTSIYSKAINLIKALFNRLGVKSEYGELGINGFIVLLESIISNKLDININIKQSKENLSKLVQESIEYNSSKWGEYTIRPSKYIRSPKNMFYILNEKIVSTELDYLIKTRNRQEVWNITWSWFDNNDRFSKEFAISENWWKSYVAIHNLVILKRFGRLEVQSL